MHPVLVEIGPLRLYSYGALIALGGVLSFLFWSRRRERMGIAREEDLWLLVNVVLVSGFLGGRLLYLFEYARPFSRDFWSAAFSFSRGFSVLGAFAAVTGGVWWFSRSRAAGPQSSRSEGSRGVGFLKLIDYVCQVAPFWHAFGRLGCFMAGCCYGSPAPPGLPWAVTFTDPRAMVAPEWLGVPLHPAQLYEAAGDLAIAFWLYRLILPAVEAGRRPPGSVCAGYFAAYGVLRLGTEFFRGDTVPAFLGLTAGQSFSLALIVFAAVLWGRQRLCTPS